MPAEVYYRRVYVRTNACTSACHLFFVTHCIQRRPRYTVNPRCAARALVRAGLQDLLHMRQLGEEAASEQLREAAAAASWSESKLADFDASLRDLRRPAHRVEVTLIDAYREAFRQLFNLDSADELYTPTGLRSGVPRRSKHPQARQLLTRLFMTIISSSGVGQAALHRGPS